MSITSTAWSREAFVLIRELNHRHVNYLQLIAITLARCAGQPTSTQVQTKLADVVNRLHAHASSNRLLSDAPEAGLLESHCLALCSNLVRMFGRDDVTTPYVRMDRVDLSAVQAFWISLLVAELMTNVLKHSLADDQGGTIWVVILNVRPDEVELRVSDRRKAPLRPWTGPSRPPAGCSQGVYARLRRSLQGLHSKQACSRIPSPKRRATDDGRKE